MKEYVVKAIIYTVFLFITSMVIFIPIGYLVDGGFTMSGYTSLILHASVLIGVGFFNGITYRS